MAEQPEIGGREPILAGVRQIACGLAMVMAGFLVIALAKSIWAARFRADALVLFGVEKPLLCMFDCESVWWPTWYAFGHYEAYIGVGAVMWMIGYAIRRVARSVSSGRPA
jgi:hypothetical protein